MSLDQNAPVTFVIPSDPVVKKAILNTLKDISNLKTMQAAAGDTVKEAVKGAAEKYEIPKKYMEKLASTYHAGTFDKQQQEYDEFSVLYEAITEVKL
jgi:predicted translin family RNA/ssDNA-binding protein